MSLLCSYSSLNGYYLYCERYMVGGDQGSGFSGRRESFPAVHSCHAGKPGPDFPVRALAWLRKSTGLSVQLAPGGSDAAVQAAYALKPLS